MYNLSIATITFIILYNIYTNNLYFKAGFKSWLFTVYFKRLCIEKITLGLLLSIVHNYVTTCFVIWILYSKIKSENIINNDDLGYNSFQKYCHPKY